jgi:uncharacterized integral membrane protein
LRTWLAVIAGLLFVIFMFQNSQQETIDVFFWDVSAPLIFSLLVSAVVGVVIGYVMARRR